MLGSVLLQLCRLLPPCVCACVWECDTRVNMCAAPPRTCEVAVRVVGFLQGGVTETENMAALKGFGRERIVCMHEGKNEREREEVGGCVYFVLSASADRVAEQLYTS